MIRKAAIISIAGPFLSKRELAIIKKEKPWGVILFKRNILSVDQLTKLTKKIKKVMRDKKFPILIDEEGGRVSRLSNFLDNSFFSQKYFGEIYKLNKRFGTYLYKTYINSISKILLETGVNIFYGMNTKGLQLGAADLIKAKISIVAGNSFNQPKEKTNARKDYVKK